MAESFEDRTEAPTPRRREEAREQGQVARSADLTAAALLLGFLLLLNWFGGGLIRALQGLVAEVLSPKSFSELQVSSVGPLMLRYVSLVGGALVPLLVGGMVIAIAVNLLQVGFIVSGKRLQPRPGLLNPLHGLAQIFKADSLAHLITNLLKLLLVAAVAWSAVKGRALEIVGVQQLDYLQAFGLGASIVYSVGLRIAVVLLVLAVLDYGYQKFRAEQQLRMTKQEIKEEMRRMEGDPKIKQRRRQIALQMLAKRLKKDVPTADVVVTNPTEFAIALKYDAATMHAPRVVAKGQGHIAARIRQIAIEHGIPIIERKPLAQALYKLVEVGQEIPEQFYTAVAEILAYVYELTGKVRRKQTA